MKKKLKIGIIGCGAIGTEIAKASIGILKKQLKLVSIFDIDKAKMKRLENEIKEKVSADSIDKLVTKSDLLIEAASGSVSANLLEKAIRKKKDIMIMSVGGLVGKENLLKNAEKAGINVYIPSGALAGIDALKSARISKIESVTLTTKKPIEGLKDAPYLSEHRIDINGIREETVIFEGNVSEAVKGFPKNINVSALLSLAGLGAKKTKVKIVVSPESGKNSHQVEIKGDFGIIKTETINVPSKANPKTSMLAALSAIATLKNIADSVKMGT